MSIKFGVCGCCGCIKTDDFNRVDINTTGAEVYSYTEGQWEIKHIDDVEGCTEYLAANGMNSTLFNYGALTCLHNDAIIHFDTIAPIQQGIYIKFLFPKTVGVYAKLIYGSHNVKVVLHSNTEVRFYLDNILVGQRTIYDISSVYGGYVYGAFGIDGVKASCMTKGWYSSTYHDDAPGGIYGISMFGSPRCELNGVQPFWGQAIIEGWATTSQYDAECNFIALFGGTAWESPTPQANVNYVEPLCKPLPVTEADLETTSYALQASNGVMFTSLTSLKNPDCDEADSDGDGVDDGYVTDDVYSLENEGGDAKSNCHKLAFRATRHACWPDNLPDELQIDVNGYNCIQFGMCVPNEPGSIGTACYAPYSAAIADCIAQANADPLNFDYAQCECDAKGDYYDCCCNFRSSLQGGLLWTNTGWNGTTILERIDCPKGAVAGITSDAFGSFGCQEAMWSGSFEYWDGQGHHCATKCSLNCYCDNGDSPVYLSAMDACYAALGPPPHSQTQLDTYADCCATVALANNHGKVRETLIAKLLVTYFPDGTGSGTLNISGGGLRWPGGVGVTVIDDFSLSSACNGNIIYEQSKTLSAYDFDNIQCECGCFTTAPSTYNGNDCWTRSFINDPAPGCPRQDITVEGKFL